MSVEVDTTQWSLPGPADMSRDTLKLQLEVYGETILLRGFEDDDAWDSTVSADGITNVFTQHLGFSSGLLPQEALWWNQGEAGLRWFQDAPDTARLFAVRWDGDAYRLVVPPQEGTAASLAYLPPAGVVAEFHSHGSSRAFFSATDDRDEQGFRIYGGVGRLDAPRPELRLQVGVYGHFAPVDWSQVFGGQEPESTLDSN